MACIRAASLESMASVCKKKVLDLSTLWDKWKGGNDGGCWPDGWDESEQDVEVRLLRPCFAQEADRRSRKRHIGSPRGAYGRATGTITLVHCPLICAFSFKKTQQARNMCFVLV